MSALKPHIHAIIPLLEEIVPYASHLYKEPYIDVNKLGELLKSTRDVHFKPLHDINNPLVKTDSSGRKILCMAWGHPAHGRLLDYGTMVGLLARHTVLEDGREAFIPAELLRGPQANVLVVGGMSCCGSALQAHWTQVASDPSKPRIDDSRIPLGGLKDNRFAGWLKGKVALADTGGGLHALQHLAADILAHRFPNDKRFAHDCKSHADYAGYAAQKRTLG